MAAPGWFTQVFQKFVQDLVAKAGRGEPTDLPEASVELWTRLTGHSEKQVARALEELFGAKELPVLLQGDIVHRTHVDRIAKFLVARGMILDEPPEDLFPAPVDESRGAPGTSYRQGREWEPRRGTLIGGPNFERQQAEQRMASDDRRIRARDSQIPGVHGTVHVPDPFRTGEKRQTDLEAAAEAAMRHTRRRGVGMADDDGRVT